MKIISLIILLIFSSIFFSGCDESANRKLTAEKNIEAPADTIQILSIKKQLPDFSDYTNTTEKKIAFFNFLRPIVKSENRKILKERAIVVSLYDMVKNDEFSLNKKDSIKLAEMANKYRVKKFDMENVANYEALIKKVDIIPAELSLTQAAIESAWGSSYFAKESNNIYGQWCFTPGCGTIPRKREKGATHEVARYTSVNQSVGAYLRNLNSHPAYSKLRDVRLEARNKKQNPDGNDMAIGLLKYSGIGMEYVNMIREMMDFNKKYMGI
jgi:Bax protein